MYGDGEEEEEEGKYEQPALESLLERKGVRPVAAECEPGDGEHEARESGADIPGRGKVLRRAKEVKHVKAHRDREERQLARPAMPHEAPWRQRKPPRRRRCLTGRRRHGCVDGRLRACALALIEGRSGRLPDGELPKDAAAREAVREDLDMLQRL